MRFKIIKGNFRVNGEVALFGDKSISHRAIIASCLSRGVTRIRNLALNDDCLATIAAFRSLGISIKVDPGQSRSYNIKVTGKGLKGLRPPRRELFLRDSGTTYRLMAGLLAGAGIEATLTAGISLCRRPMSRITFPLRMMGAGIRARRIGDEEYPPIGITPGKLEPLTYRIPVASAQVKSCLILSALFVDGTSRIIEPVKTRDHTERMLSLFRAAIKVRGDSVFIKGGRELSSPGKVFVPGDISSAAFFIVLAMILPGSSLLIKDLGLNPTRTGILSVLKRMGGRFEIKRARRQPAQAEPRGDILARTSILKGAKVHRTQIPSLIDELPVLMVAACFARGRTVLEGIQELRVKETDRIDSMVAGLSAMGADIRVVKTKNGENIVIRGNKPLHGAVVRSFGDHRTAMSMAVAGLAAGGQTVIEDTSCVKKSFPAFFTVLKQLLRRS